MPCFFWGRGYRLRLFAYLFLTGSGVKVEATSLASQIFACAAFEILVIVCGHWWVFESACVHLPPGVMMCRNVRSVTPLPDLSDSRALQRLYHHLLQHYGYYFIALTLS